MFMCLFNVYYNSVTGLKCEFNIMEDDVLHIMLYVTVVINSIMYGDVCLVEKTL